MRLIAIILAVIIFAGCSSEDSTADSKSDTENHTEASSVPAPDSSEPDTMTAFEDEYRKNEPVEVVDKDGNHIGEMKNNGHITVTDRGILHTYFADNETTKKLEYCLYDPNTGKTKRLGWLEGEVFENCFNRVEIGGHVYTLAVVGDMLDNEPEVSYLVDIDLDGTVIRTTISEDAFPYMAACEHNGKLLYMIHDNKPDALYDRVYEYTPGTGKKEVITVTLDDDEKGDTLRQLWSDGEKVYVLRVRMNTRSDVKVFVDTYDKDYNKLSEQDITEIFIKALPNLPDGYDVTNEMLQPVAHFAVIDGKYIYYENFSTSRFLYDLGSGEPLTETNACFEAFNGSGKMAWFWSFGGSETGMEDGLNAVFELKNGTVEKSLLNEPGESKYQIYTASESKNGTRLYDMGYRDPHTGERLPQKLVWVPAEN